MKFKKMAGLLLLQIFVTGSFANTPPAAPTALRAELLKNAYSISVNQPAFSWEVQDADKDEVQSAYRLVFSRRLSDVSAQNYLWDSGWVSSSCNTAVQAAGLSELLATNSLYYWQVQTKDRAGDESPLSAPVPFTTAVQWNNTNGVWLEAGLIDYSNQGNAGGNIYYQDVPRLPAPTAAIAPAALSKWTNYRVEQDVTIVERALGIVFRANGSDNYQWQFRADNNTFNPHYNYTNSYNTPVSLSDYGVTIQLNVPFHLRIDAIDDTLTTYINNIKVDERIGRGYSLGTIGYRTGQFETGTVDNVVVANLHTGEIIYAETFSEGASAYANCTLSGGSLNVPKSAATYLAVEDDLQDTFVNEKTNFVFFRHKFEIEDAARVEKAIVAATATNTESSKQYVFELFCNGQSLGVGPARNQNNTPQGNLQYYNSYDVTALLQTGDNVIGAIAYNRDAARAFLAQMTVYYTDGTSEILVNSARDAAQWKGKDGTLAFGQNDEYSSPSDWYRQHKEHINALKYPFGFSETGYTEDATWRAVKLLGAVHDARNLVPYTSENSLRYQMPADKVVRLTNGNYVVTLEKEVVGGLQLDINSPVQKTIEIRLGEDLNADGSVRSDGRGHPNYIEYWTLKQGEQSIQSLNMKNFRYVEIIGSPVEITAANVKGYALRQEFDDELSGFHSSNNFLNELYDFTKYSIKATNQDVWTDSNARERGPYEGDAIINMASSNTFSANYSLGRHSHEYLINNQTWPQEYKLFSVEMAWMDYLYTGDRKSIDAYYAKLKNKFPGSFDSALGLVSVTYTGSSDRVLIDWPEAERDNYQLQAYTSGYNAVYAAACRTMANIAALVGNEADRIFYQTRAEIIKKSLIEKFYNAQIGAFDDAMSASGALSEHYAQHATAYALACGIYDSDEMASKMAKYIQNQGGFKTSIYAAFFVLKGLYNAGADNTALQFMADEDADKIRTWAHVLRKLNATISPEAWDPANKPNMTFSHPWGSAPANAISQGMFGVCPIDAGFETFQIKIQPGSVPSASIKVPTVRGTIEASYTLNGGIAAQVKIPANTQARVSLPADSAYSKLLIDGEAQQAEREGKFLTLTLGSGAHTLSISGETSPYFKVAAQVSDDGVIRLGDVAQVSVTAVDAQNAPVDLSDAVIAYESSDNSIVTVSSTGEVTAVGVGKATLAVTVSAGGQTGLATTLVRVTDRPFPGDDKIQTVEIRLDNILVDETVTPTLVGIFGDGSEIVFSDANYTSDNEAVAQVNADGTVSFLSEGAFTLKATTSQHFEKLDEDFDFARFEITPFYTNEFNDNANPFTGVTTNMSAANGRLFVGKSANAIYAAGTDWTDYIITATVNPVAGTGSVVQPGGPAATFHFRANSDRTQLYMWQIFSGNYLKKHVNISETGSVITAIDGMNPAGQDNRIAIAAEGNRIMTYANGKLVDVAEYSNYSRGTVGVRTGSSEEFYLDDFAVGTRKLTASLTGLVPDKLSVTSKNTFLVKIRSEKGTIRADFDGVATVKLYSATGVLLDDVTASGVYIRPAAHGFYILSVGGRPYKVVV
ncbi:MAG: family 78 glycoside hydrolase catalytic domain [Prevotella sp.]|jgi:hypothetical protein|nr:family 78 glycoside hydrolase catalytic domain [Prevotella sp.]